MFCCTVVFFSLNYFEIFPCDYCLFAYSRPHFSQSQLSALLFNTVSTVVAKMKERGNCEEELPKKPVGRLSAVCRSTVGRQLTNSHSRPQSPPFLLVTWSAKRRALDAATTGCQKFSDIRSRVCSSFRHNCSCSHVNPEGGGGERVYLNG